MVNGQRVGTLDRRERQDELRVKLPEKKDCSSLRAESLSNFHILRAFFAELPHRRGFYASFLYLTLFGALADRIGRRPLLIGFGVLGQVAVFGPARRAAAVPPAVATLGA